MNLLLSLLLVSNLQVAPGRTQMLTRLDEQGWRQQLLTPETVLDDTTIDLEGTWGMAVSAGNFDADPEPEYVCRLSDVGQQNTFITRLVVLDDDLRRLWAQTWGVMGNPETGTPTIADLDGDGRDEIIVPMVETFFPDPPEYKCRIYALDGASGQTKPGWPFICPGWPDNPYNDVFGEVVAADINDDDELEVVFITTDFNSARKGGPSCYALSSTGDSLWRTEFYPGDTMNQHGCWTAPAVADLDNDGRLEIVCHVNLHGRNNPWPLLERRLFIINSDGTIRRQWQTQGALSAQSTDYAAPVVADVDNDGALEIVIVRRTGFLDVFDTSGTRLAGFPVDLTADAGYLSGIYTKAFSSPAVADLCGDERLEIVCGSFGLVGGTSDWGGALHAFKADGSPLSGFPVETRNAVWHSPGIGNADSLPGFEVLTAGCDSSFYIVDTAGESLPGWPKRDFPTYFLPDEGSMAFLEGKIPLCKTPLLVDCDGDGLVEILVTGSDGKLHQWDTDAGFNPADLPWPTSRFDMQRTGWYRGWQSGIAGPPAAVPALLLVEPNPATGGRATLRYSLPEAGAATVSVFDVSGRGVLKRGVAAARSGALALDVGIMGPGIYLVRLESGARAATVKLVVGR